MGENEGTGRGDGEKVKTKILHYDFSGAFCTYAR